MRVVKLDCRFIRKLIPVLIGAPETSNQIPQRTGHQEKLLHEAQALSKAGRVIGIKDPSERFCRQSLSHRANKIAMAEHLEVEVIRRRSFPKPEGVDRLTAETD